MREPLRNITNQIAERCETEPNVVETDDITEFDKVKMSGCSSDSESDEENKTVL